MAWKNVQYENGKMRTNEGGGGGGSTVTITPTLSQGTKIADYSIDGNNGELYAPQGGGVSDVEVDGVSVVNQQGVAEIQMPTVPAKLIDLSDIDLSNLQDGQIIKWDATNSKWVNANESGGGSGHIYSTTEQLTDDVWIDGSPIYEITFFKNSAFSYNTTMSLGALPSNFGTLVDVRGWIRRANNNFDALNWGNPNERLQLKIINGNFAVYLSSVFSPILELAVIYRYTKTTD